MERFEGEIDKILNSPVHQIKNTLKGINLSNKILTDLKVQVEREDFETVAEEIYFFKEVKPSVMSYLIYFTEVRSCEIRKPKAGIPFQIRFFEKEIKKVNKFFYRNSDFSYYMELGHSYQDHAAFFPANGLIVVKEFQTFLFSTSLSRKIFSNFFFFGGNKSFIVCI